VRCVKWFNSNGVVSDEILGKDLFKLLLRRASDLSIKSSSLVRSFNFATWELCLVVSYSGDKRVVNNILVRIKLDGSGGIVVVEAQSVLDELHD